MEKCHFGFQYSCIYAHTAALQVRLVLNLYRNSHELRLT